MIQIVTDSTASLPRSLTESLNIDVMTLHVHYDGKEYKDATMDLDEFYQNIADMKNNPPKSSQPNQIELEEYFEKAVREKNQVVGIFMSSSMSGTFEGALRAARVVEARCKEFSYAFVDSLSNSLDEGFAVLSAVAAREAGASCYQVAKEAADTVGCTRFLFAPESLSYLRAGGRIGSGAALLGNAIKLTPIFTVSDGVATVLTKVRTQKKAAVRIMEIFADDIKDHELNDVVVHYIGSKEPALKWCKKSVEPFLGREVPVLPVSPVIGCHVGPAFGIAYQCKSPLKGKLVKAKPEIVCSAKLNREKMLQRLPFVSRFI